MTALHYAARDGRYAGHAEVVRFLLSYNCDVNIGDNVSNAYLYLYD